MGTSRFLERTTAADGSPDRRFTRAHMFARAPAAALECAVEPLHFGQYVSAAVEIDVVIGILVGNHSGLRHRSSKRGQPALLQGNDRRPPVGLGSLTDLDGRI